MLQDTQKTFKTLIGFKVSAISYSSIWNAILYLKMAIWGYGMWQSIQTRILQVEVNGGHICWPHLENSQAGSCVCRLTNGKIGIFIVKKYINSWPRTFSPGTTAPANLYLHTKGRWDGLGVGGSNISEDEMMFMTGKERQKVCCQWSHLSCHIACVLIFCVVLLFCSMIPGMLADSNKVFLL